MKFDLQGTTMQMLNIEVENGETVVAESGRLVYMSDNVRMEAKAQGGLLAGFKRLFAGESFFLVHFSSESGKGLVSFGSEFPGKIIPVKIRKGRRL